jgi:subtilisin family serine protease
MIGTNSKGFSLGYSPGALHWGDGTSGSAPLVSAVAGIIAYEFPSLTPLQIESRIKSAHFQLGSWDYRHVGGLNAWEAIHD